MESRVIMGGNIRSLLVRWFPRQQRDLALDAYFEQLLADFARLNEQELPPKVVAMIGAATEKWRALNLSWSDAFAVERTIFHYLPDDMVAARAWHIRDRYRQVVPKAQYEAYDRSRMRSATGAALQAENDALLVALIEFYIFREGCDAERTEFSHRVQVMTFVLLAAITVVNPGAAAIWTTVASRWISFLVLGGLVFVAGWWTRRRIWKNAGIAIVVLDLAGTAVTHQPSPGASVFVTTLGADVMAGLFGGAFSLLQRVQAPLTDGDGLANLLSLRIAKREIFLAPITGAVAAITLYCIFAAGLIEGSLFPHIVGEAPNPDTTKSMPILSFLDSGPAGTVDHAKSLVWSFIAGFSERFVPDAISRLSSKAAQSKVAS